MKNYFGLGALLILMACNNADKKSTEGKDSTTIKTDVVIKTSDPVFKDAKLERIYTSYISLKNALVSTKQDQAKLAAKTLGDELKSFTGCENTAITAHKIETARDIVEQRKEFTALSSDVIAMFKHAELTKGTIYVQHCPMANKGDGGDWLASEKKIQNPYYGSEMMECGAVIEEIKAK